MHSLIQGHGWVLVYYMAFQQELYLELRGGVVKMKNSIKDYPIRIIAPKGKTRGRPSKYEVFMSEYMSKVMAIPENKKMMRKAREDFIIYGIYNIPQKLKLPK